MTILVNNIRGTCIKSSTCETYLNEGCIKPLKYTCYQQEKLFWTCKYCGENREPKCNKCIREDDKLVSDELYTQEQ